MMFIVETELCSTELYSVIFLNVNKYKCTIDQELRYSAA